MKNKCVYVVVAIFSIWFSITFMDQPNAQNKPKSKIDLAYEDSMARFAVSTCFEHEQYYEGCYGIEPSKCEAELTQVSIDCFFDSSNYNVRQGVSYVHMNENITEETTICIDVILTNKAIDSSKDFGSCSQ
jgi:hypothetical protein